MNLKDFLQLAGQQGKVVVMGEDGNVKGVFLSFDEFQRLSGANSGMASRSSEETLAEKANREILQAQLEEVISISNGGKLTEEFQEVAQTAERIDSVLSKRAQELFKSIPFDPTQPPHRDYRPPQVASTSDAMNDEEISTNFDDI